MNVTKAGFAARIAGTSAEARQLAVAILEVLGGEWAPGEAAAALKMSLPRYYALESRALAGLVAACEPLRARRRRSSDKEISELQKKLARLERECARRQALLRASQRTVGLGSPAAMKDQGKRRKRRPMARALRAVSIMRAGSSDPSNDGSGKETPG
jgi:hypothetical protein